VPVWHEATKEWVREGRLAVLGIAQEHHPDRCRLFAQWKGFDFPILHDPINVIGAKAVPLIIAIDEQGIVRAVRPQLEDFEQNFLNKSFKSIEKDVGPKAKPSAPDIDALRRQAELINSADAWRDLGDGLALWHSTTRIKDAISAYSQCLRIDPEDEAALFRLGVCYRMRHESTLRQAGDFQKAVDLWSQALAKDPNQYIWRRRIQQYGSRLDKPYPFYDWMEKAEKDIKARGEEPVALQILPSESEIAQPIKKPIAALKKAVPPDPDGRIHRDTSGFIEAEVTAVPSSIDPGGSARIHVVFRPNVSLEAHWNNEAEPLRLWVELPEGWVIDARLLVAPQPEEIESAELRRFDFDIQSPKNAASGHVRLSAYALYYACEGIKGTCQFLRQDIDIEIDVIR